MYSTALHRYFTHCCKCRVKTPPKWSYPITVPINWHSQPIQSSHLLSSSHVNMFKRPLHSHIYAHACSISTIIMSLSPASPKTTSHKLQHYQKNFYEPHLSTLGTVMVGRLDKQTWKSEFVSYWVSHSFGLVPHLSKKLSKLLLWATLIFSSCCYCFFKNTNLKATKQSLLPN